MVVTMLANAGHVFKEELTYEMLYIMFDKINEDLKGRLNKEKESLVSLFQICESNSVLPEVAMMKHTARISTFTNSALFYARQSA